MTSIEIVSIDNSHPEFYRLLGPFLANRGVAKELDGMPWDEEGKRWYIALVDEHVVAGFAAAKDSGSTTLFCSAWVHPDFRRRGVYRRLLARRLECEIGRTVRAVATDASHHELLRAGFIDVRRRGRYFVMEKKINA